MVVACRKYAGDAQMVARTFLEVAEWLKQHELPMAAWIGIYEDARDSDLYVDPVTKQMRGEIWIPFSGEARSDAFVEIRWIEPHRVAVALHSGDIADVGRTVRALKHWVQSQGLRVVPAHRQVYLKTVPGRPQEAQTEVQIPLRV